MGGNTTGGLGDGNPPAGSRGGVPVGGLGKELVKVVTSKFYAFCGSISHIFTYRAYMPMFSPCLQASFY